MPVTENRTNVINRVVEKLLGILMAVISRGGEADGILRRFAACFTNYRDVRFIEHPVEDLVALILFGERTKSLRGDGSVQDC